MLFYSAALDHAVACLFDVISGCLGSDCNSILDTFIPELKYYFRVCGLYYNYSTRVLRFKLLYLGQSMLNLYSF